MGGLPLITLFSGFVGFYFWRNGHLLFIPLIIGFIISGLYSVLTRKSYHFATPYVWGPDYVCGAQAVNRGWGSIIAGAGLFLFWYFLYT